MEYNISRSIAEATVEKIRDLRTRMNLTQSEFCERFGLTFTTYRQWESGRRLPDTVGVTYLQVILTSPETVATLVARAKWKFERSLTAA
jgi:DNA-binding transcriptional regulator YiaG